MPPAYMRPTRHRNPFDSETDESDVEYEITTLPDDDFVKVERVTNPFDDYL
jgi:hypothetical protein